MLVAKVPLDGLIDLPVNLLLALCTAAEYAVGGQPEGLLAMTLCVFPKTLQKAKGITHYSEGSIIHQVLDPLTAADFNLAELPNYEDLQDELSSWLRLFMPPRGKVTLPSKFLWALIDQVKAKVPSPSGVVAMALEYVPDNILPPRSDKSKNQPTQIDCVIVKEMMNALRPQ